MAEDRGKDALAVEAVERVGVGVADAGRLDLDQDFAGLRSFQIDLDDLERLLGFERDSGAGLHSQLHISLFKALQGRAGPRFTSHDHFLPMQEFSAWV